ncbi:MAG: AIPR family protein [Dehalococcoidia bacterium]|nr:AIPR family protein [Dehalococcoidia bacterium]
MLKHIPVSPDNIRSLKSPHDQKVRTQYAYVALADFPTDLPLSPDPRVPKPNDVIRRVKVSLESNDGIFHILNRGITISARTAEYDNAAGELTLDIPDGEEEYGILDGGHTYYVVRELVGASPKADSQYVKIEILTGVESILPAIASARNFSRAVKEISLAHYRRELDWLKTALGDTSKKLRWRENDDEPFDVMEYIQVIAAFDLKRYSDQSHPLESYKNSAKCLDAAAGGTLTYLAPVVPDIVRLYDTIRFDWWPMYTKPDEDGRGGRPGRRREVTARQRGTARLLQFPALKDVDPRKAMYHVEKGLAVPLAAAFRSLLVIDELKDTLRWKTDPFEFWRQNGPSLVRKVMEASDQRGSNPQVVGRDKTVYEALYESVELMYLKASHSSLVSKQASA